MKIGKTADELIVQETPGCLWVFASLFLFIGGIFIYGSLGGLNDYDTLPWWSLVLSFLMGAIAFSVGAWLIFYAPVTKVIINLSAATVTHKKYGLSGKRQTVYDFDQIKTFCVIESKDSDGDPIWSFGMELTDGATVEISSLPSHSENFKRDLVFQTNEFMCKLPPSHQSLLESKDETDAKIG